MSHQKSNIEEQAQRQLAKLLFGIRRSIRYHNCRRAYFDRINSLSSFISVLFSSAAIASLLASGGKAFLLAASSIVSIVSALNLVLGASRKAREHSDFAKRFVMLEKDIVGVQLATDEEIRKWIQRRLEIEADEPPVLKVLDSLCHNDQLRSMGYDPQEFLHITRLQRTFAQFKDISDHKIQKRVKAPTASEAPPAT
jgi:hypothetical protein